MASTAKGIKEFITFRVIPQLGNKIIIAQKGKTNTLAASKISSGVIVGCWLLRINAMQSRLLRLLYTIFAEISQDFPKT